MNAIIAEETAEEPEAAEEQPKASRKDPRVPRRAPDAPVKGKAGKKASRAKKTPKAPAGAKKAARAAKPKESRPGSKTTAILELLRRPGGATAKDLMKATDWQAHSVRGFLSGTLRKKMGLEIVSAKSEDGERSYSIKT
jgi:hypothetical protein